MADLRERLLEMADAEEAGAVQAAGYWLQHHQEGWVRCWRGWVIKRWIENAMHHAGNALALREAAALAAPGVPAPSEDGIHSASVFVPARPWPDPTPEMLADSRFEAVWQVIKRWDINVPDVYAGYSGATGNHVRAILDALEPAARGEAPVLPCLRKFVTCDADEGGPETWCVNCAARLKGEAPVLPAQEGAGHSGHTRLGQQE